MSDTTRTKLEAILSNYAAMRIHQQVAIDQIEAVYAAPKYDSPEWVKTYAGAMFDPTDSGG